MDSQLAYIPAYLMAFVMVLFAVVMLFIRTWRRLP